MKQICKFQLQFMQPITYFGNRLLDTAKGGTVEKAIAVANYFVKKSLEDPVPGAPLTIMKLIKLVYIAHGWHLAIVGKPLIEENAEAWKFGPVIKTVYDEFREYGRNTITSPANPFYAFVQPDAYKLKEDPALHDLLDQVWTVYRGYTAGQLVALTHQKGTPWSDTWHLYGGKDRKHVPIHNALIKEHYEQKLLESTISNEAAAEA